jgi:hypothetical protein
VDRVGVSLVKQSRFPYGFVDQEEPETGNVDTQCRVQVIGSGDAAVANNGRDLQPTGTALALARHHIGDRDPRPADLTTVRVLRRRLPAHHRPPEPATFSTATRCACTGNCAPPVSRSNCASPKACGTASPGNPTCPKPPSCRPTSPTTSPNGSPPHADRYASYPKLGMVVRYVPDAMNAARM